MPDIKAFEKIAPYLRNPLVLVGFIFFLLIGLLIALFDSGLLAELEPDDRVKILISILTLVFVLAIIIVVSGLVIQYLRERRKSPQRLLSGMVSVFGGIDEIAAEVIAETTGQELQSKNHWYMIEGDPNNPTDLVSRDLSGNELKRITANDLEKLPRHQREHIAVLQDSMMGYYKRWKRAKIKLSNAKDESAKQRYRSELGEVSTGISYDLDQIELFLSSFGMYLDDHYLQFRDAARTGVNIDQNVATAV